MCSTSTFRGTKEHRTNRAQKTKRKKDERVPFILSTWITTTARTWGRRWKCFYYSFYWKGRVKRRRLKSSGSGLTLARFGDLPESGSASMDPSEPTGGSHSFYSSPGSKISQQVQTKPEWEPGAETESGLKGQIRALGPIKRPGLKTVRRSDPSPDLGSNLAKNSDLPSCCSRVWTMRWHLGVGGAADRAGKQESQSTGTRKEATPVQCAGNTGSGPV